MQRFVAWPREWADQAVGERWRRDGGYKAETQRRSPGKRELGPRLAQDPVTSGGRKWAKDIGTPAAVGLLSEPASRQPARRGSPT